MIGLFIGVSSYLTAGIFSLVWDRFRFWFSALGWAGALAGLVVSSINFNKSGVLIEYLGKWGILGIEIKVDFTTLLFAILVVVLNIFTLMYFRNKKSEKFCFLYNLLLATSFSMAFTHDLFNIYVTIELMSLISILLIGFDRHAYQIYAGIKYLILSSLGMSLYLIGLAMIYKEVGYLGVSKVASLIGDNPDFAVSIGLSLMISGLAVKGGVLMFGMWLPDAHSYSGTVVSALLSGMAIKCGLIGMLRISSISHIGSPLLLLGTLTGIGAGIFALFEKIPKRILAYSTISQIGYILLAIGIGSSMELMAGSLHILFHGLYKSLMFLSVGHGNIGTADLSEEASNRSVPIVSKVGFVIGALSIAAVPPFEGFFSKSLILDYASPAWVWVMILVISVITALVYIRLGRFVLKLRSVWELKKGGLSILIFSLVVAGGGLTSLFFTRGGWRVGPFCPAHLIESSGMLAIALVLYLIFKQYFQRISLTEAPFSLDNSLISLFTGILLMVMLLVL
ncbi:MAG: complex I subunit 5 family protein [Candidatus Acetothermia bacterium]